jgi:hypothetical protein
VIFLSELSNRTKDISVSPRRLIFNITLLGDTDISFVLFDNCDRNITLLDDTDISFVLFDNCDRNIILLGDTDISQKIYQYHTEE